MSDRVKVIIDGTMIEVSGPVAAWLKKLGDEHERKRQEMLKAMAEALRTLEF